MNEKIANNIFEGFYDTITFTGSAAVAAATPYYMFTTPFNGSSKLKWQTNQSKNNVCPYTRMTILAIAFKVFVLTVSGPLPSSDDVEKVTKNLSLSIFKNTVPVLELPVSEIGGGNQIDGFVANSNNSTLAVARNGAAHIDNMYKIGAAQAADGSLSTGITFVKDENLDVRLVAENAFTPAATVYAKLYFWCDTYQDLN